MKLETYDDVLASIKKNHGRKFHLLLGNGFSMAYDPAIFSYNALHEFVAKLNDKDLSTILNVIETKNFEVIMHYLDGFSALVLAFDGPATLKNRIDDAKAKLKSSLLDAVQELHPEHVFKVPEEKSKACSAFLATFLSSGGSLFSTNYDLLWTSLRAYAIPALSRSRKMSRPSPANTASMPVSAAAWRRITKRKQPTRSTVSGRRQSGLRPDKTAHAHCSRSRRRSRWSCTESDRLQP